MEHDDVLIVEEHILEGRNLRQVTVEELRAAYRKFSLKYRDAFINKSDDMVPKINAAYDRVKRYLTQNPNPSYGDSDPKTVHLNPKITGILSMLGMGVLINMGSAAIYSLLKKAFKEE